MVFSLSSIYMQLIKATKEVVEAITILVDDYILTGVIIQCWFFSFQAKLITTAQLSCYQNACKYPCTTLSCALQSLFKTILCLFNTVKSLMILTSTSWNLEQGKCLNSFILFLPLWVQVGFDSGHVKKKRKALCVINANDLTGNTR